MKSSRTSVHSKEHAVPLLRFEAKTSMTTFSGLVIFQTLFKALQFRRRLNRAFQHLHEHGVFGFSCFFHLLVLHLVLGFRRLSDIQYYRNDPLVARLLGLRHLPSNSAFCRNLAAADSKAAENAENLVTELTLERLAAHDLKRITIDFDGSVLWSKGHAEGTAIGFNKAKKGARSYYPLFGTVSQLGLFLAILHRPGNVHDSNGAEPFMLTSIHQVRQVCPQAIIEVRIDSAFFQEKLLVALDEMDVELTCSVPWRRYPELKAIVNEQQVWRQIEDEWSYCQLTGRRRSGRKAGGFDSCSSGAR